MADVTINGLTAATAALVTHEIPANEGGSDRKVTLAQMMLLMGMQKVALATNATANATTTPVAITGLTTTVGVGTWHFRYLVRYQSSIVTTGVKFSVNHTGTVTAFMANHMFGGIVAADATAGASQAQALSTGAPMRTFTVRAKSTAGTSTTISTDSANADMYYIIEGTMIVTVSGNIELWHGSETAASTQVMAGSALLLTQLG